MSQCVERHRSVVLIDVDGFLQIEAVDQQLIDHLRSEEHPVLGLQPHRMTAVQFIGAEFVGDQIPSCRCSSQSYPVSLGRIADPTILC